MLVLSRAAAVLSTLFLATTLLGCVKDAPTILDGVVTASEDVNPDGGGTASPVVVRYYELKTTKAFDSAGFFDIYEQGEATLGADMLDWGELDLIPGGSKPLNVQLNAETRFVGFLVAFRDIEKAAWRGTIPVTSQTVNSVAVELGELDVAVKPG